MSTVSVETVAQKPINKCLGCNRDSLTLYCDECAPPRLTEGEMIAMDRRVNRRSRTPRSDKARVHDMAYHGSRYGVD